MQKKIIALAIAAAISAPAFASNANVEIYGKAFVNVEAVNNDLGTNGTSGLRVQNDASRLGMKGHENLGDGLSGIYQFEVGVDATGSAGTGFGAGTRNSGVGIKHNDFGQVMMGIWDTPFKVAHNKVELFDNTTSFSAGNLIGRAGGAATSVAATAPTANFATRQNNVVLYTSPTFSGVTFAAAGSEDTNQASTTAGAVVQKRLSTSVTYDANDIFVAAAYESRKHATVVGTTDSGLRLVGRYTMGDFWVGATYESYTLNYGTTTATTSATQNNMELVGQYKMGNQTIAASYAVAGSLGKLGTAAAPGADKQNGASQVSLRYGYNFSKRTELFAAYAALTNDAKSTGSAVGGSYGFWGTNAGSKQSVAGVGLIHSF